MIESNSYKEYSFIIDVGPAVKESANLPWIDHPHPAVA
jgi:hypothetical protein